MRKESCFEDLRQDLRYRARTLLNSPGFMMVAVLTLALDTGADTAIFSVVNAALLKPLPFREPENLVELWRTETLSAVLAIIALAACYLPVRRAMGVESMVALRDE